MSKKKKEIKKTSFTRKMFSAKMENEFGGINYKTNSKEIFNQVEEAFDEATENLRNEKEK